MPRFFRYQGGGATVIEQMRRDITKLTRENRDFREANENLAIQNDELLRAQMNESDGERAIRMFAEVDASLAWTRPSAGYRFIAPDEFAAYQRAAERYGVQAPRSGAQMTVPVNFHLTRGEFVHWNDAEYLHNCPSCGVDL